MHGHPVMSITLSNYVIQVNIVNVARDLYAAGSLGAWCVTFPLCWSPFMTLLMSLGMKLT